MDAVMERWRHGRASARGRARAWAAVGIALAATVATARADAVPFGSTAVTVELGEGARAERYAFPCPLSTNQVCTDWRLTGFAGPPPGGGVNTFALAGQRRIVASTGSGVFFTDDRGARWRRARFEGALAPLSIAFDRGGEFGAAVGSNGEVWTTEDRGETWRSRRDGAGRTLVDVVVVGRTLVFSSDRGGVWVSPDGGTSVRTIADSASRAMPVLMVHEGAAWAFVENATWYRADATGALERVERR